MIIEESDFKLTPVDEALPLYDLELLYTIKPKNGEERQEFKVYGYGMSLEACLQRVANYRLRRNHPDESITLKQFLEEYKQINLDLNKWLKN